jgi:hypothetical protein
MGRQGTEWVNKLLFLQNLYFLHTLIHTLTLYKNKAKTVLVALSASKEESKRCYFFILPRTLHKAF